MEISKKINSAILIILGVVIIFSIYSSMIPTAQSTGNSMSDANLCAANSCFYNASRTNDCSSSNVTGGDLTNCARASSIPFSGIFSGTGVIFIILMAALILIIIKAALNSKK